MASRPLLDVCASVCAPGGDLVVTFANWSHADFVINWLVGIRRLGITSFVVVALDGRSLRFFSRLGVPCALWHDPSSPEQAVYTLGFRAICNEKPHLVLCLLSAGYNVVWTDSDIVWLRNPLPFFRAKAKAKLSAKPEHGTSDHPEGQHFPGPPPQEDARQHQHQHQPQHGQPALNKGDHASVKALNS